MSFQKIIIGIGGNIKSNDGSHPVQVAMNAINCLQNFSIQVTEQSSWYESEPIPKSDQPNFFNCKPTKPVPHPASNISMSLFSVYLLKTSTVSCGPV